MFEKLLAEEQTYSYYITIVDYEQIILNAKPKPTLCTEYFKINYVLKTLSIYIDKNNGFLIKKFVSSN